MVASHALPTQADSSAQTRVTDQRRLKLMRVVWLVVAVLAVLTFLVGIPQSYQKALILSPETHASLVKANLPDTFPAVFLVTVDVITFAGFASVAGLLFWRRSDDWVALLVGWVLLLTGFIYTDPPTNTIAPMWLIAFLIGLGEWSQVVFFYVFPGGRFTPYRLRWLVIPLAIWRPLMWGLLYLPNLFANIHSTAETYGRVPQNDIDIGVVFGLMILGVISLIYRYRRRSTSAQKQQIKWLLAGMMIALVVGSLYTFIVNVFGLFSGADSGFLAFAAARMIRQAALLALPVSLAFSVLRYRLLDIDLLLSRGLVYGALTLLYIAIVVIFQQIFAAITGGQQSTIAVALSTALIAAGFQPLRRRLQRFIDRRFFPLNWAHTLERAAPTAINSGALTGTAFGPYQVLEPVGRGGMGEVYKGFHPTLNRSVAIKILPEHLAKETEFRARFEREARTVAALRHPNIVNVFDFGELEGKYYMVMEFIDGQELGDLTHSLEQFSLERARPLIHDIASALDYAHAQGVVHRDVKPSNVMVQRVTSTGPNQPMERAILMDFGIARLVNSTTGLTNTGMVGTLDYIAPEQIMSAKEVDARADVYALGVIVYQMLTGQLPFSGDNPANVIFAHLQQEPPDPRILCPEIPEAAAAAILRAMSKKPEDRFQTAGEFAAALG